MKNTLKWFGVIALVAVIGFSMAACGGDGGDDSQSVTYTGTADDGTTYKLIITETPKPRYAAQVGDDYLLLFGVSKTSSGKVENVSGDELTLKPFIAPTSLFTATVSDNGLIAMNGMITWSDGTTANAPSKLAGSGSSGTGTGSGTPVNPGTGGSSGGSQTLTLSGEVYTQEMNMDAILSGKGGNMYIYKSYSGSVASFSSNVGGKGSITNGKMSFSVGAPDASLLEAPEIQAPNTSNTNIYKDIKIQPSNARSIGLDFDLNLEKENININMSNYSSTMEMVMYIYFDKDCTYTATGGTVKEEGVTMTYSNVNLKFKSGWNVMNIKVVMSGSTTGTVSMNNGDLSSCMWVYGEDYYW